MTLMTILIALVGVLLMGAVLIQNPKGGGLDATMGGRGASQMFGAARSADFIEKATWYLFAILIILCIVASIMVSGSGPSGPDLMTN